MSYVVAGDDADVTQEQANWQPPGRANSIGAVYAHVIVGADLALSTTINGEAPLIAREYGGHVGLSELMPTGDWHEWARGLEVDLQQLTGYAEHVYADWNRYLQSVVADDRAIDLSAVGMGTRTMTQFLTMQIEHFSGHTGEIACLKGIQGIMGYVPGRPDGKG